jgi:NAD(P)-dependent dehydrogenase (short-subunit alcohol dehydrogenase family)
MARMKHVVITGVSRGLGRAMTIGFAADGWTVSGCGTDTAALQSLASELGATIKKGKTLQCLFKNEVGHELRVGFMRELRHDTSV